VPVSIYAYVDEATGEGYYPHHDEEGEVDLAAVRAALAELAQAGLDEELAARIREHLLAHLREAGEAQAATADVNAEAAAGAPALELEARVAELDRKNRRLRRTLRALAADRARERADALADEVAAWTAEGKVLPAYAPQVHALLAAGDALPLELEGRRTDVATLVREVLAALPPVVQFGERLSLAPPEDRVPLSPAEKAMLASLGVTTSDYRRYGGR
jgi:hypothetical protein